MTSPTLSWLPPPGADWADRLRAVVPGGAAWAELIALATFRLDGLMTIRLDRVLTKLFTVPSADLATVPVRMALLGSSTLDHLIPGLRVGALRRGLHLTVQTAEYGQYATGFTDPESPLHDFRADTALFAFDAAHLLGGLTAPGGLAATQDRVRAAWTAAQAAGAHVLQQAVLPTILPLLGENEHRMAGSGAHAIAAWNAALRPMADIAGADVIALDTRAASDGLAAWHDPVLWHRAKQDVQQGAAPVYGDLVARLLAARQGRSAKALVLDLDNTLWGGVIGDDGMAGITLGQGSALGEAHVSVQAYAHGLSKRGVILAVCSKNDDATAREPFEHHPDMVLRLPDIACFVANWTDKATNLRTIAAQLNIGLDALVFVDDNPAERAIVRRELPMVAVPELPDDPALYAATIAAAGYFEAVGLTQEDTLRSAQYQANAERAAARDTVTDMAGYLESLEMELRWGPFDQLGLARIVQLTNKTNQFNLTTRRTTEAETLAHMADPAAFGLQLRLLDRYGDNGMIALVSGRVAEGALHIENWLMSCRVLGRGVEATTLGLVVAEAVRHGATIIHGTYRPTAKNGMVRDHYAKLGFSNAGSEGEATLWTLGVDGPHPAPPAIRLTPPLVAPIMPPITSPMIAGTIRPHLGVQAAPMAARTV